VVASSTSNAENTRPQPAATATVTATDVLAGDGIHSAFNPDRELARIWQKAEIMSSENFDENFQFTNPSGWNMV
jgi:hypothetical protein